MGRETEVFLAQIANQSYTVMENSRLFERVRNLSIRDSLTDLFNHRHIMDLVNQEFARVGRYQDGFSLLMIDIDHFKRFNDDHGHPTGDIVLREVATVRKDMLRPVDAVGRYGGAEFMIILPHTGYDEAVRTAERVRARIDQHVFRVQERDLRVTVSVGVATAPSEQVDSAAALIREADQALYRAKDLGRNHVA